MYEEKDYLWRCAKEEMFLRNISKYSLMAATVYDTLLVNDDSHVSFFEISVCPLALQSNFV
jgi:hypothetical protein